MIKIEIISLRMNKKTKNEKNSYRSQPIIDLLIYCERFK